MRLSKRNTGMAQAEQFRHLELVKPLSLQGGEEPLLGGTSLDHTVVPDVIVQPRFPLSPHGPLLAAGILHSDGLVQFRGHPGAQMPGSAQHNCRSGRALFLCEEGGLKTK